MSFIDIFAIICLAVLVLSTIAIIIVLGVLPGRIARTRQHPYARRRSWLPDGLGSSSSRCGRSL